jgi:hypothetical protein
MGVVLRTYLRIHDRVIFCTRVGRGYVQSKLSPGEFGSFPMLMGKVRLRIRGKATFGARFMVEAHVWDVLITVADGATLTVGEGVFVNGGVSIEVWHDVRIGSRVATATRRYMPGTT